MKKHLTWIEFKLDCLWQRIENACGNDSESLSRLRIIYGLFILTLLNLNFTWIASTPQGLFRPKFFSLSILFNGFPNYSILLLIELLLVICGFCLLLGIKARVAGIVFVLVYLVGNSFRFSFGKIDHGEILLLVFILGLSFTNWGAKNALIRDRSVPQAMQNRILAILAVILCFGMFTAGYEKALYWVDFDLETGGFLRWFYNGYFTHGRDLLLAPVVIQLPPQTFELADYFAVIFELIPLVALLSGRKWWLLWLLVASIFHLANTLLLNIGFIAHAPVYLTFINLSWSEIKGKLDWLTKRRAIYFLSSLATALGLHYLFILWSRSSVDSPLNYVTPLFDSPVELDLYVALCTWLVTIMIIGFTVLKKFGSTNTRVEG